MFATFPLGHAQRQARAVLAACVIHGLGIGTAVLLADTHLSPARPPHVITTWFPPAPEGSLRTGLGGAGTPGEEAVSIAPMPTPVGMDAPPSIAPLETGTLPSTGPGALDVLEAVVGHGTGTDVRAVQVLPDEPAELIRPPVLDYPLNLRTAGIAGVVSLEFVVDSSGLVERAGVRVIESSHPAFTASVLSALPDARFRPGRIGGQPVRQLVRQSFRFVL